MPLLFADLLTCFLVLHSIWAQDSSFRVDKVHIIVVCFDFQKQRRRSVNSKIPTPKEGKWTSGEAGALSCCGNYKVDILFQFNRSLCRLSSTVGPEHL